MAQTTATFEAYLDVENAGAIAPTATIKLYISGSYGLLGDGGLSYALLRAVDDDAASTLSLNKGLTAIALGSDGSGSEFVGFLPGGTYTLTGQYSGDCINAASTSQPVTVNVAPEVSTLVFAPVYANPITDSVAPITSGATVGYGEGLWMDVTLYGAAGTPTGAVTGMVTFTDGATILAVVPVSAGDTAEYNASSLARGAHSVAASYGC